MMTVHQRDKNHHIRFFQYVIDSTSCNATETNELTLEDISDPDPSVKQFDDDFFNAYTSYLRECDLGQFRGNNRKSHPQIRYLCRPESLSYQDIWDQALSLPEEETKDEQSNNPDEWKELAPSEKLLAAASSLGNKKKVLDYGCGNAWAGIIAAKCGCTDVMAVDVSAGPVRTAECYARFFGVEERVKTQCVDPDWLQSIPDKTFDGFICSNVLDVIPPETAEAIISESARIVTEDAMLIIGMNYYMSPETCSSRGIELVDGNKLYVDGILRLVSRSDDEWRSIFAPYFTVERLEHFAWPGEQTETRRLFYLRKKA